MARPLTRPVSRRTAQPEIEIERVPWSTLGPEFVRAWGYPRGERMPEHLEILGQTGTGKSFFERTILTQRAAARGAHIVVVATKPADATLAGTGWPVIESWPPPYGQNQVIYWAKAKGLDAQGMARQRAKVLDLLNRLWQPRSNIIVAFDEVAYLDLELRLRPQLTRYYREARALGITVVSSTQRPQGVPRYMHSEASWSVFFAPKDEEDAERMAQVAGSKRIYAPILLSLNRENYEFLIVHNLTGERVISWIDGKPSAGPPKTGGSESHTAR
jgi:hypothetical protein